MKYNVVISRNSSVNRNINNDTKLKDVCPEEEPVDAAKTRSRRRLQDSIESKDPTRKMNYDRRLKNNERRSRNDADYDGPSRRLTIDRRRTVVDRRKG